MGKRGAPAGGAGTTKKSKKGIELPPIPPDALKLPHLKLFSQWVILYCVS